MLNVAPSRFRILRILLSNSTGVAPEIAQESMILSSSATVSVSDSPNFKLSRLSGVRICTCSRHQGQTRSPPGECSVLRVGKPQGATQKPVRTSSFSQISEEIAVVIGISEVGTGVSLV